MQLAITQNPYTKDPKNLWKALRKDLINNDDDFDPAGMEILKARLGKNPKFKIK